MPKDIFVFKPFTIYQPYEDVMKVSTDSVLLGCFAKVSEAKNALDIGCGTGILSLMMAYKNPSLNVVAVDVNQNACQCAGYNVSKSNFSKQITVLHTSLQEFSQKAKQLFDIIICNPPYFTQSLKSPNNQKNLYRHQEYLSYDELLNSVNKLLNTNGSFYVLVPYYEAKNFDKLLYKHQLFIHSELSVFSKKGKEIPYVFLYEIKKNYSGEIQKQTIFIQNQNHTYTTEYLDFTIDFYLFA